MNYDKFDGNSCFEDFDSMEYLENQFYDISHEGKYYYTLSRTQAFMLLKANKFTLTERKKKSVSWLINQISKTGKFPTPPKHPIRINLKTKTIESGVTRLFTLLYQRSYNVIWLEFVV